MNCEYCNKMKCGIIPAFLIHLCVGTIYCWPLLEEAINESLGCGEYSSWAFSLAIFTLGIAALLSRYLVNNLGFRSTVLLSTLLFGSGLVISGISILNGFGYLFILGYGILGGLGIGLGYMAPIKNLMLWFKNNMGLATGISIFGFGLSKFICTPILSYFIDIIGIGWSIILFGILSTVLMFIGYLMINRPPDWKPKVKTWEEFMDSIGRSLDSKDFSKYWLVFLLSTTAGIMIMYSEKLLLSISTVFGGVVGLTTGMMLSALFNSFGRLIFPGISDHLRNRKFLLTIMLFLASFSCLLGFLNYSLIPISMFLVFSVYGGIFALVPSLLADKYGIDEVSGNHGLILTAWSMSGVLGPLFAGHLISSAGLGVGGLLISCFFMYFLSGIVSMKIRK